MLEFRRGEQFSLFVQVFDDIRVRILDEFPGIGRLRRHVAFAVHELHQRQAVLSAHIGVILTEGRGDMHDAGTV